MIGVVEAQTATHPSAARALDPRARWGLGAAALLGWTLHAGGHAAQGVPEDALWCCVVGELLLGLGVLSARPRVAAVGALWLIYGFPLWVIALVQGDPISIPSWATHLVGPVIGVLAVRSLGLPRRTWLRATLGLLALQALSRVATPPALNVNLAHSVYAGWEQVFPSYPVYYVLLLSSAVASFVVIELVLRRVAPEAP